MKGHSARVQLQCSSGHLQVTSLICLQLTRLYCISTVVQYVSLLLQSVSLAGVSLLITSGCLSFLLSHPQTVVTFPVPFPLSSLSLPFSFSASVCLLSCAVLQGSLADLIYAISLVVWEESFLKPTLNAECSCGRLWASTAWLALFKDLFIHNETTMHVTKMLNLHSRTGLFKNTMLKILWLLQTKGMSSLVYSSASYAVHRWERITSFRSQQADWTFSSDKHCTLVFETECFWCWLNVFLCGCRTPTHINDNREDFGWGNEEHNGEWPQENQSGGSTMEFTASVDHLT